MCRYRHRASFPGNTFLIHLPMCEFIRTPRKLWFWIQAIIKLRIPQNLVEDRGTRYCKMTRSPDSMHIILKNGERFSCVKSSPDILRLFRTASCENPSFAFIEFYTLGCIKSFKIYFRMFMVMDCCNVLQWKLKFWL